ncbi:MAG: hypothetical protein AAGL17_25830, partial [Cyanobacteria bacterium J06576_12]
ACGEMRVLQQRFAVVTGRARDALDRAQARLRKADAAQPGGRGLLVTMVGIAVAVIAQNVMLK